MSDCAATSWAAQPAGAERCTARQRSRTTPPAVSVVTTLRDDEKRIGKKVDAYNKAVDRYNARPADERDPSTLPPRPAETFDDPGKKLMKDAQDILAKARKQRNSTAETARSAVRAARDMAPKKPSYAEQLRDGFVVTHGPGSEAGQAITAYGPSGESGATALGGEPIDDWPPVAAATSWYPVPGGHLTQAPADSAPVTAFRYDPAGPTPSLGGPLLSRTAGPRDNATLEARDDVLTFTGPPLTEPMDILGPVSAR